MAFLFWRAILINGSTLETYLNSKRKGKSPIKFLGCGASMGRGKIWNKSLYTNEPLIAWFENEIIRPTALT